MSLPSPNPAPTTLDEILSTGWLSWALGVPVTAVEVTETLVTVATKVRMRLELASKAWPEELNVFVKAMVGHDPLTPFYARISETEARFYRDVVNGVGINHPPVRHVGIDPKTGHGLLLMDDIKAAGATFLQVLSPYTHGQTTASLDQIAKLHASHWGGAGLDAHPWIFHRFADMAAKPWRSDEELTSLLTDGRADGLAPEVTDVDLIHRSLRALADRIQHRPEALVHGDAHAGNLYERDRAVSLIDWQLVQRTHWSIDVGYHLAAVLSIEDRRAHEQELLAHYLDRLRAYGVEAPSFDGAFTAYRESMVYGLYLWAITRKVHRPIIVELTRRLGTAVTDLDTFKLLDTRE